jgi:hypothetical protein
MLYAIGVRLLSHLKMLKLLEHQTIQNTVHHHVRIMIVL